MSKRVASCSCGKLSLACEGQPVRISVCHCLACQKRTGGVFGAQARFPQAQVSDIAGSSSTYERVADSGNRLTFHFCQSCGSTVYWTNAGTPGLVTVAVGAFADPGFPAPRHSVFERTRHGWAPLPEGEGLERLE